MLNKLLIIIAAASQIALIAYTVSHLRGHSELDKKWILIFGLCSLFSCIALAAGLDRKTTTDIDASNATRTKES